jgi:hypothetical protein
LDDRSADRADHALKHSNDRFAKIASNGTLRLGKQTQSLCDELFDGKIFYSLHEAQILIE